MGYLKELLNYLNIDFIQCAVVVLGISEVLLARANNVWLYPTGIVAILLSGFSLFKVQLYGECLLHLYYLVMSVYGWWYWLTKQNTEGVKVTYASKYDWIVTTCIVFGGWIFLFFVLDNFTPSPVPSWDALASATGWAGMWLLAKRKVENWILLNLSNLIAIPLLIHKGLPLYAALTAFLFAIACKGYFDWRKIADKKGSLRFEQL